MNEKAEFAEESIRLEQRLMEAAQAFLAHRGTNAALIPLAGAIPVQCIAIGSLSELRKMLGRSCEAGDEVL